MTWCWLFCWFVAHLCSHTLVCLHSSAVLFSCCVTGATVTHPHFSTFHLMFVTAQRRGRLILTNWKSVFKFVHVRLISDYSSATGIKVTLVHNHFFMYLQSFLTNVWTAKAGFMSERRRGRGAALVMCSEKSQLEEQAGGRARTKAHNWLSAGVCNPLSKRKVHRATCTQAYSLHTCINRCVNFWYCCLQFARC